ncbi:MAG: hypothetical protein EP297_01820 [Gammaproteobacteria bacterium]|nr:MAG: hypothetical protein EP297_01820 [Gammaproteobacteria bacterium]
MITGINEGQIPVLSRYSILTLNDRFVVNSCHPNKLLRYFPLNGRKPLETLRSPGGQRRTAMPQKAIIPEST